MLYTFVLQLVMQNVPYSYCLLLMIHTVFIIMNCLLGVHGMCKLYILCLFQQCRGQQIWTSQVFVFLFKKDKLTARGHCFLVVYMF